MRELIDKQRAAPGDVDEVRADLETAYEELRVADEEVRAQQLEIERLSRSSRFLRAQQERLVAELPLAVLTTDLHGTVQSANAAAQRLLGVARRHLLGKPLLVYVDTADRRALRDDLATMRPGADVKRALAVTPRGGEPMTVDVFVSATADGQLTWVVSAPGDTALAGAPHPELPKALAALADLPVHTADVGELARLAVTTCQEALGEGFAVSLTVGSPVEPRAVATSGTLAQQFDGAQIRAGEGPCETAYESGATVVSHDITQDGRWPALRDAVQGLGLGPVVAAPLQSHSGVIGALNVYGRSHVDEDSRWREATQILALTVGGLINELDVRDEIDSLKHDLHTALESRATIDQAKGIILADQHCTPDEAFAFLALVESHEILATEVRDLRRVLDTRPTIDQAKGIIMADRRCGPDEAFAVLRKLSMDTNVRVADVAAALVYQAQAADG